MSSNATPEPQNAQAYSNRGRAYFRKEEWDKAIADFSKAIELDYQHVSAYSNRGRAYFRKEEWDQAIADFSKAIERDPKHVSAHSNRGRAYFRKEKWDQAIADFSKAIERDPKHVSAHSNRGRAYFRKEEWDNAIADFDKTLQLNPQQADAYFNRERAYLRKGGEGGRGGGGGQPDESSEHDRVLFDLLKIVRNIRSKIFYGSGKPDLAHYTSLDTLKHLVSKDPGEKINKIGFRLYNSDYTNDPEEGSAIFKIINARIKKETGQEYDLEKRFYKTDGIIPYHSPAYIGSFISVGSEKSKDELPLWRTYGKQRGEEAAGSCLIFPREQFAKDHPDQSASMRTEMTDKDLEEAKNTKLPIYNIVYTDSIPINLHDDLEKLAECLEKIGDLIEKPGDEGVKNKSKKKVRKALDIIRFLFKASHYKGEREVRILEIDYLEENTEKKSGKIKVDAEQIPPHFYLETPESFCFSEVILGWQAQCFQEWKRWIEDQDSDLKVKRSDIPYRN